MSNDSVPLNQTDVWTADMRSWGMSRYVNFPLTEFANWQFGFGPDGVYTPMGELELSYIETPDRLLVEDDKQIQVRKRLNYVYTYSAHDEPLQVRVTADYNGERVATVYTQDARSSDRTRAVRCSAGRGYASNYIRLRVGGPAFDLSHCEVEVISTQRRI